MLNVVVNRCASTADKNCTARFVDQRNAKVFAGTDDREVGVSSARE